MSGHTLRLVAVLLAVAGLVFLAVPGVKWRAYTLLLVATGKVPGISLTEALGAVMPNSGQRRAWLLPETRNPYAVLAIPGNASVSEGRRIFVSKCMTCHGPSGEGGPSAPSLFGRHLASGDSDWAVYRTVRNGVPGTAMPSHADLTPNQIWSLVAHIRSFEHADTVPAESPPENTALGSVHVSYDTLASATDPETDWLTYSGSYSSQRRTALTQITPQNVSRLALRWTRTIGTTPSVIECSPLVLNGIMYVTSPPGTVKALDAHDGHELWSYTHDYSARAGAETGVGVNRGVALLGDTIYYGAWDSQLIALHARTGNVLWQSKVADHPATYISSAPLAIRDKVVVGVGTKVNGGRGVIAAFDAKTGKLLWKFMATPAPGQPGSETWPGDSWRQGGAGTWLTGSYDPDADLLYWGIGNPKPDYITSVRRGDNLYSDSVVALRGATGALVWYFQFTPADDHDWDANQIPIIADLPGASGIQKRVLWANRNGFYYVLDRLTGKFITGTPFARQNWASSLDAQGRPMRTRSEFRREGDLIYPGFMGATNWWSPSMDRDRNLLFVPVLEQAMIFTPGNLPLPAGPFYTAVRALEPATGKRVWEYRLPPRTSNPHVGGGLLATRSGVVFGADRSTLFALDTISGEVLWTVETGSEIHAAPISYAVDGEQYLTVISGQGLMTFALPREPTRPPAILSKTSAASTVGSFR